MKATGLFKSTLMSGVAVAALGSSALAGEIAKVEWVPSAAPQNAQEMARMFTSAKARTTYQDGSTRETALGYDLLFGSQTKIGDNTAPAGTLYDEYMRPIPDPSVDGAYVVNQTPDGSALMEVAGRLYHVSNYEYSWLLADGSSSRKTLGDILPSSVVLTELSQDPATGALTPVAQQPVDFGPVGGLTVACNATVTPWGTFLTSSENYSADGRRVEADRKAGAPDVLAAMSKLYFGGRRQASAYEQGVLPEITVLPGGETKVVKHYAVGRGTYEMAQVMPDQRTVYGPHDGTNQAFTMFIADRAGDLSSGTLYAAKLDQTSDKDGGAFGITWIKLGHATDAELGALVDGGIAWSDMFHDAGQPAPDHKEILVGSDKTPEYLTVKNEKAAAFLETMRYAGIKGATTEFRKAEGMAFDPEGGRMFLAISDIGKGMKAGTGSGEAGDHIRLTGVKAGAVYSLPVKGSQLDNAGNAIDSAYVAVSMSVPQGLMGLDLAEADAMGNKADLTHIANPDNLYWSAEYKTLFVGEDSGMHLNNTLWAWQDGMTTPVPLLYAAAGAELTGLRVQENIGGHPYALTNAQHVGDFKPGDNARLQAVMDEVTANWLDRQQAPTGYITGMPQPAKSGS